MLEPTLLHDAVMAVIGTGFGGLGTFLLAWRRDRRDASGAQSRLTSDLLEQVRKQLEWSGAARAQYAVELEVLRASRYALEEVLLEMRDCAIAARALVHERERGMGVAETVFPPLPRPMVPVPRAPPAAGAA